jgi:glycosyltransferase involved in cell wall biosynthesis
VKALVVAPQPFFTPRGTPLSVYYRTLVEAELGVEVDLLTYGQGRDVDLPGVRIIRIPRFAALGDVRIGPSLLKLFLDGFLFAWTIGLLLVRRYDFVHAHEEAIFFCRFLKPVFRFKLVYDMHSSLPQQLSNFRFTTSRLLIAAFRGLERLSLRGSDAVITICPDLANYALGELDDPGKHLLIENSIFEPVKLLGATARSQESSSAGLPELPPGRRLVVYAGTLEPYQGIDLLLEAFRAVVASVEDAYLVVAGGRPDQVARYEQRARELGLDGAARFIGQVAPDLARALCSRADVLVSPRVEGTNTPLKVYEQLASGIPLVATDIYSHTQVLDPSVAFLVPPTAEGFAGGVIQALTDREQRTRKVEAAKALYEDRYARGAYTAKMQQLLERLR